MSQSQQSKTRLWVSITLLMCQSHPFLSFHYIESEYYCCWKESGDKESHLPTTDENDKSKRRGESSSSQRKSIATGALRQLWFPWDSAVTQSMGCSWCSPPESRSQPTNYCSLKMWIFSPADNYLFISPPNEPKQNLFQSSTIRMHKVQMNSLWDLSFLLLSEQNAQLADGDHGPFCRFLPRCRVCGACSLVHEDKTNKVWFLSAPCGCSLIICTVWAKGGEPFAAMVGELQEVEVQILELGFHSLPGWFPLGTNQSPWNPGKFCLTK